MADAPERWDEMPKLWKALGLSIRRFSAQLKREFGPGHSPTAISGRAKSRAPVEPHIAQWAVSLEPELGYEKQWAEYRAKLKEAIPEDIPAAEPTATAARPVTPVTPATSIDVDRLASALVTKLPPPPAPDLDQLASALAAKLPPPPKPDVHQLASALAAKLPKPPKPDVHQLAGALAAKLPKPDVGAVTADVTRNLSRVTWRAAVAIVAVLGFGLLYRAARNTAPAVVVLSGGIADPTDFAWRPWTLAMSKSRRTVPARPFKGQAKAPCHPEGDEETINGGCWIRTKSSAPCPANTYEHSGRCYYPVGDTPPTPSTADERNGEKQ